MPSGVEEKRQVASKKNVKLTEGLRPVWWLGIVLAWLLSANIAAADEIIEIAGLDVPVSSDGTGDTPAADLTSDLDGWFFSVDTQPPLPADLDPSQPWTSAPNIATMDYWLSLVIELQDDPSLLTQLYGLGMIDSPDPATPPVMQVSSLSVVDQGSPVLTQESLSDVPEPVTLGLFLGGLALLAFARQVRPAGSPGSID
jgi:hypothetical protein